MKHEGPPQRPVCDFCCAPDPCWAFPAPDVDMGVSVVPKEDLVKMVKLEEPLPREVRGGGDVFVVDTSTGEWCACAPCAVLVEEGDLDGLALRSVSRSRVVEARPHLRDLALAQVRVIHGRILPLLSSKVPWDPDVRTSRSSLSFEDSSGN